MVSPSLRFADEETETQTGRTRSLPGVPWPCKRKSQRKTFGALVFELKNLNYFLYGLRELAEQMDVVCVQTHVQTHSHMPLPTQRLKRCTAPAPTGQWICQPRGRLGSWPPLLPAGPGGASLLRVLREVAWRGEVGPPTPPCQVRSEDRGGVGAEGGLTSCGRAWQVCPPAGRSHCPLWSRRPQLPLLTCPRGSEQAEQTGWALRGPWSWEFISLGPQTLFFPPWKDPVLAPSGSPARSQKGGRTDSSHPGKDRHEQ